MAAIATCGSALIDYGARNVKPQSILLLVLPLVVSISFLFIADLSPRGGVIRVSPQNLASLVQSLPT